MSARSNPRLVLPLVVLPVLGALAFALAGCRPPQIIDPPPQSNSCTANSQCGEGQVCSAGVCVPGACTQDIHDECRAGTIAGSEKPWCCKPYQLCNELFQCVADPESDVGDECSTSDECGIGEFCSGGTCYSPEGRTPCTATYQCGQGERCDVVASLCVPDIGACTFCADFPELCCDEGAGERCDAETGFCVAPGQQECEASGSGDECREGQKCDDLGRCVQCTEDADCGPGTACNAGTGSCYSVLNHCESDADCSAGRRCRSADQQCTVPLCEDDDDCSDSRQTCDLTTFTCALPPANCAQFDEADEPNDNLSGATPMSGSTYSATLCRGNTDLVSFPVTGNKRYRATIQLNDATQGVVVAMLNAQGAVQSQVQMTNDPNATITAVTAENESGTYYIRLAGSGTGLDLWSYTITLEETVAPQQADCASEQSLGVEPNNTAVDAHLLGQGAQAYLFGRCGLGDVDFYRIPMVPLFGMRVTVEFADDDGDLKVNLYDAANPTTVIDTSDTSGDVETVDATEGPGELLLEVRLRSSSSTGTTNQSYTVTLTPVARPAACEPDPREPDGSVADAEPLAFGAVGTTVTDTAKRCIPADVDFYKITMPPGLGGTVGIEFTHAEGDLRLDLLDAAGNPVEGRSSNRSNAQTGAESIELPQDASVERVYYARVRLHAGTGITAQQYTISASTYDASSCLRSEPQPDNGFEAGQCVGTFATDLPCAHAPLAEPLVPPALATCASATTAIEGCATTCGAADPDTYRVGKINNGQLVRATLKHVPAQGDLGLSIVRQAASGSIFEVTTATDTDGDGTVDASIIAPTVDPLFAREYAVVVKPLGSAGYAAQPYTIAIDVGPECARDQSEPNDSAGESTVLRPNADASVVFNQTLGRTLCGGDVDVYELIAFAGEQVTATLDGPDGLTVDIGTRPADLDELPVTLAAGAPSNGVVRAQVTNASTRQLYFVVRRTTEVAAGTYDLTIQVD